MHGWGLSYVQDGIPCKQIKPHTLPSDIKTLFIEMKLRNKKYILVGGGGYNPQ